MLLRVRGRVGLKFIALYLELVAALFQRMRCLFLRIVEGQASACKNGIVSSAYGAIPLSRQ